MAETTRFGLEKVGGSFGGSIADNGGKYTTTDRDTIDKLFAFFENHKHDGGSTPQALASPTVAASAAVHTTGGTIANGTTRYYKYSLIDQFGLETAASPELTVTLPAGVVITDIAIVTGASAGGSALAEGTYYYAVTGNTAEGQTTLGPESVITVQAGQNQVDAVLPALPTGVTSWNLWRMAVTDQGWTKVADSHAPGSFSDVGYATADCLCDPTTQPPTDDLAPTGSSSITITPDPSALATAVSWRLYESDTSGFYDTASLVASVVATVVGNPPPSSYLDTGAALLAGQPLLVSTSIKPSHAVAGGGGGGGGGADSHFASDLKTQGASLVSGTAFPVYIQGASYDLVGHDLTLVYETNSDSGSGDELQVNTSGVYSRIVTVEADGFSAGDVIEIDFAVASVGAGDWDLPTFTEFPRQIIIPPGVGGTYQAGVSGPTIFMPRGTRLSAKAKPYFTGTPTGLKVGVGLAMASGTPAGAEFFAGVTGLTVNPLGGELDVSWSAATGATGYDVLLYASGAPVPGMATSTGGTSTTFTGLTNGVTYTVIVLAKKTLGGVQLYSTPAIATGTPSAPATGAFTDDFNRTDHTALGLPNYPLIGGNSSGLLETVSNKMVNTGSAGPTFAGHDLLATDKIIGFTHFAVAGAPLVVYLATNGTTGNPRALVSLDGSSAAPVIDYYNASGTHTAITMSAAGGSSWVAYQGSSKAIELRLYGINVEVYQEGTLCWQAVLPDYVAGQTYMEIGMSPGGTAIDNLSVAEYTVSDDPGEAASITATPTGGGGVTVTWDVANGVTPDHFHVIIQEGFTYSDFLNVAVSSPRTAAFTGATPGTGYTARVAPVAPDGTTGTYRTSASFTVT